MKVISIGFFLPSEEEPVVWRGPMLHKALEQFLTDVYWGDDLEYLLIDLPPGTGDISLSLATFLPNAGMVVVTTPQPVAQKVAERAASMADKVKQRLLGVVENMCGLAVRALRRAHAALRRRRRPAARADARGAAAREAAARAGDARGADDGVPFVWAYPDHPVARSYRSIATKLSAFRPRRRLPVMEIGTRR